jgi:hypothetical protein
MTAPRDIVLWLRAYRVPGLTATIVPVAVLAAVAGTQRVPLLSLRSAVTEHVEFAALVPLVIAVASAVRGDLDLGDLERSWPLRLRWHRLVYVGLSLLLCCLVPAALLTTSRVPGAVAQTTRNVLGLFGLAMVGGAAMGARRSWTVPTIYVLAAMTLGVGAAGTPEQWAWLLEDSTGGIAWWIVGGLGVVGAVSFVLFGARHRPGADMELD